MGSGFRSSTWSRCRRLSLLATLLVALPVPASPDGGMEGETRTPPSLATPPPSAESGRAPRLAAARSMFAWRGPSRDALEFAVTREITTLYVNASPGFSAGRAHGPFVREGRRAGLSILALAGAPDWAVRPDRVESWVREVRRFGGFDGVVLDVEPYVDPRWKTQSGRRDLIRGYLRGLRAARRAAGELRVVATVPFWFDGDDYADGAGTLVDRIVAIVDGIVILAYRDRAAGADGILALSQDEILAAERAGKSAVVAVQTDAEELDKLTFHEEGERAMERELEAVIEAFAGRASFAGIGLHYFASYARLSP